MRITVPVIALLALAGFALTASRRGFEPARGDEGEPVELYDPALDWYPMTENEPVYDPRDVRARTFSPSELRPSEELKAWLKAKERLMLRRYELGDGGVTIGYGHYEPYSRAHLIPEEITREEAEQLFEQDIESRGARWVRAYVKVPLTQNEFDALTSLAFNLSPNSFQQIANALNRGEDWKSVALQFTRPGTNLEKGLIARREKEFAMFDQGIYA
jgi:GH24 family phage-related lysozyme (muramidase)